MNQKTMVSKPLPQADNRRSGEDRRKHDALPPGQKERRRSVEPRKPDVIEREMSNSEWTALGQDAPQPDK